MISAEAPVVFAKACEIFILELTLRAWGHATENQRHTLQHHDVAMAASKGCAGTTRPLERPWPSDLCFLC